MNRIYKNICIGIYIFRAIIPILGYLVQGKTETELLVSLFIHEDLKNTCKMFIQAQGNKEERKRSTDLFFF